MSRFVSAGTDPESAPLSTDNDAWTKAQEQIDRARTTKSIEKGNQEDGKSLYEVLQANKAAKQEAFEEAAKLKNQFRALDDSEIEFLDSIRDSARQKEDAARSETAEQMDAFRRQRAAAEQDALRQAQQREENSTSKMDLKTSWTATKKRRRVGEADEVDSMSKMRKALQQKDEKKPDKATNGQEATINANQSDVKPASDAKASVASKPTVTGLGLNAYDSDDDD